MSNMLSSSLIKNNPELTLPALFRERVKRTPHNIAYRQFEPAGELWRDFSWEQTAHEVARWQAALLRHQFNRGDKVAIMLNNRREWMLFEQAALGLGLVVVPLYTKDRAENFAYILDNADVRLLLIEGNAQWNELLNAAVQFTNLEAIISLEPVRSLADSRLHCLADWLPEGTDFPLLEHDDDPQQLATIVYTSGTTGKPKGVMLSHQNILSNCEAGLLAVPFYEDDLLLSFLPLSHMFERVVGYYVPMMAGSTVAYARSIKLLAEDLRIMRPTILVSVPRIFERIDSRIEEVLSYQSAFARYLFNSAVNIGWLRFEYLQNKAKWHPKLLLHAILDKLVGMDFRTRLGGRIRITIAGGAALALPISKTFIGLGVPILQGYGLTETSPLVSVNPEDDNDPASVGLSLSGIEVRLSEDDELLIRGPNIMLGYWKNPQATADIIDLDGWLHSGDKAAINDQHISITGRIKDIIVLSTGEKLTPTDMEAAASREPCFEQVMIYGENRPFPIALIVLNMQHWQTIALKQNLRYESLQEQAVEDLMLNMLAQRLQAFPGYARIRQAACSLTPWTVENDLLTPTLKIKRHAIAEFSAATIERLYAGH